MLGIGVNAARPTRLPRAARRHARRRPGGRRSRDLLAALEARLRADRPLAALRERDALLGGASRGRAARAPAPASPTAAACGSGSTTASETVLDAGEVHLVERCGTYVPTDQEFPSGSSTVNSREP